MADGAPNQIDVQLSLLGDESKQEVAQLTSLLSDLVSRMPAAGAFGAEEANRAAQQAAGGTSYTGGSHGFASTAQVGSSQSEQQRLTDAQDTSASRPPDISAEEDRARSRLFDTLRERGRHVRRSFMSEGYTHPDDRLITLGMSEEEQQYRRERQQRSGPLGRAADAWLEIQRVSSGKQSTGASTAPGSVEPDSMQPVGSTTGEGPPGLPPGLMGSDGASQPPQPPPGVNREAYAQFSRLIGSRENQPRFGEWQTQDYLRMAARTMGEFGARRAQQQQEDLLAGERDTGPDRLADWTQRGGAALARAEQVYPTIHALGGWVARSTGVGQHDYSVNRIFNPTADLQRMEGSGYSQRQGGQIDLGPVAFQAPKWLRSGPLASLPILRDINPFDTAAGDEGAEQAARAWREGISNAALGVERAGEINDVVNTAGWNRPGQEDRNEAFKRAGFETFGNTDRFGNMESLSTEAWKEFVDNFTHLGQNTFEEAITVMEGFNDAANATGLSLDEVAQQAIAAGEALQEFGGTGLGGARFGESWMRLTGTPAEVGTQMLNNPWFQTEVARAGVNPAYAGALPDEQITRMSVAAVQDVDRMVSGTHDDRRHPIEVNGRVVGYQHTTGREQDDAMAAQQLGMDVDVYRTLRKRGPELANLEMAASAYENQLGVVGRTHDLSGLTDKEIENQIDLQAGPGGIRTTELKEAMEAAGFSAEQREEVMNAEGGVKGSIRKIREITGEMTGKKDGGPESLIGLTPEAKRWFEINGVDEHRRAKDEQNRGGQRLNAMGVINPPTPRASNAPSAIDLIK